MSGRDPARITHVVSGLAAAHGGPSYSVPALNAALRSRGAQSFVRTVAEGVGNACSTPAGGIVFHEPSRGPLRILKASASLRAAIDRDAREGSIIHAHGLWLLPNIYPSWSKGRSDRIKLVHAPRGMLAPAALEISSWKKCAMWQLWQRDALQAADCLHATAESEYEEIRRAGLRNPVAIIQNGIDVPSSEITRPMTSAEDETFTILSLGRIHPKKGLDTLVRAWAKLENQYSRWSVKIVGPAERGYDQELKNLARSLGLARLVITGAVEAEGRTAVYRGSDLFVLPTRNENFGLVVAEALAAGLPVISTKGAPWKGLVAEKCGWWIDHGEESLSRTLALAMDLTPLERGAMGARGREWMRRDFGWPGVAEQMLAVYAWLNGTGSIPSSVRLD